MTDIYNYIYLNQDIPVNDKIFVRVPTLRQIFKVGYIEFQSVLDFFTATPTDLMVELDRAGLDWNTVDEWDLFYQMIFPSVQADKSGHEIVYMFLGGIDLDKMRRAVDNDTGEFVIVDEESGVRIDRMIYVLLMDMVREAYWKTKNVAHAMNDSTRRWMIDDAKDEAARAKAKGYKNPIAPLISSMVNSPGFKYDYEEVLDLNLFLFMDAVKRTLKIDSYNKLMTGIYTGNVDSKKIPKKEFNWVGDLKTN